MNESAPAVVIANLAASAPPAPEGIDQMRSPAEVSPATAVNVATAIVPSGTVNAAAEVTDGAGPGMVVVMVAASRSPSELHTAPAVPQARPAGRVMTTAASPPGRAMTSQPMLLGGARRRALSTAPPLFSNSAPLKSR